LTVFSRAQPLTRRSLRFCITLLLHPTTDTGDTEDQSHCSNQFGHNSKLLIDSPPKLLQRWAFGGESVAQLENNKPRLANKRWVIFTDHPILLISDYHFCKLQPGCQRQVVPLVIGSPSILFSLISPFLLFSFCNSGKSGLKGIPPSMHFDNLLKL
jgi:hypothetical protein